jgi:tetratricopeptide (TPR) repeat protein
MGKKHRQTFAPPVSQDPAGGMEEQALAELAGRRFRKSRDLFKLLCKQDREKHLPGLIAANRGLAEELMAKGQVAEAEQVIAYLKTIAPAVEVLGMDVLAAQRAQDWPRALRLALECWTAAKGTLAGRDRTLVADALVLAFPQFEAGGAAIPEELRDDLAGLLAALRALSESRFADAQDALRPIPRGSLFADWKMLVKGWLAFHAGDRAKASQLLDAVPPDSAPGRAASALRPFLGAVILPDGPSHAGPLGRACRLLGQPALGPILTRAEQLWQAGQHFQSWMEMRHANGFPSELPGLYGALSDFYFRVHVSMRGDAVGRYVIGGFCEFASKGHFKSPAERRLICRALGSDALANDAPEPAEDWWREFVAACPPDDPRTPRMAALVFAHLGHWMAQPDELDPVFLGGPKARLRDAEGAMVNLKDSIGHDPTHLPAYLDLLKVFAHEGKTRDRNQLLEAMTRRFPNDKAVLFEAGRAALQRDAHAKGLELLERAHSLDRLDPETSRELVRGHFLLAREQYEKKALQAARETLTRMEEYAVRDRIDFNRGLDLLRARHAGMEMAFGEEAVSRAQLAAAQSVTRTPAALLLLTHVVYRANGNVRPRQGPFWKELKTLAAETVAERALLLEVLEHGPRLNPRLDWKPETLFVRDCLAPAAGAAFTRDEATSLHVQLRDRPGFEKLLKDLVKAGLRRDPTDPRFLILKELSIDRRDGWVDRFKLSRLREEAARRGDKTAVVLAAEVLDRLPEPPPGFTFFNEPEDDIPFGADLGPVDDDDDLDERYDLAGACGLSPDQYEAMNRMTERMTNKEFAKFRKKSAKWIPLDTFDLLFGTRGPSPPPARRAPAKPELF